MISVASIYMIISYLIKFRIHILRELELGLKINDDNYFLL